MAEFTGLIESDPDDLRYLDETVTVKAIDAKDFEDYKAYLRDAKNSPLGHMRAQRQSRNDCQGQSLANGEEKRGWYCTGSMTQLSDIYAYNASEYSSSPRNIGRDQGTSIAAGVKVLVEGLPQIGVSPGLPTETDWPYSTYERNANSFASRAKQVTIDGTFVSEHQPMPNWEGMLAGVAAGGSGHIGTYWPPRWSSVGGFRLMDQAPTGGGGHATEIIWALELASKWYLVVWNSHGDKFYLMSQRCYDALRQRNFSPFGAYLLLPDKAQERWYDRRIAGGGYWPAGDLS